MTKPKSDVTSLKIRINTNHARKHLWNNRRKTEVDTEIFEKNKMNCIKAQADSLASTHKVLRTEQVPSFTLKNGATGLNCSRMTRIIGRC